MQAGTSSEQQHTQKAGPSQTQESVSCAGHRLGRSAPFAVGSGLAGQFGTVRLIGNLIPRGRAWVAGLEGILRLHRSIIVTLPFAAAKDGPCGVYSGPALRHCSREVNRRAEPLLGNALCIVPECHAGTIDSQPRAALELG